MSQLSTSEYSFWYKCAECGARLQILFYAILEKTYEVLQKPLEPPRCSQDVHVNSSGFRVEALLETCTKRLHLCACTLLGFTIIGMGFASPSCLYLQCKPEGMLQGHVRGMLRMHLILMQ